MRAGRLRPAAQKALLRERRRLAQHEEFPCEATKKLNDSVAFTYLRSAKSVGTWSRQNSWLSKFFKFASDLCTASGNLRTSDQCLASSVMCRHFIASVANEGGVTRPRSARAALSKYRQKRGWTSLNNDEAISAIVSGHEAANPRTKRQSAGFSSLMVKRVVRTWGKSASWWRRQVATLMALGFVSIMRLGEMCSIQRAGIRIVFRDGSEADVTGLRKLPSMSRLKGMLFHLPWRKNHVAQDCWVPVACTLTIRLVLHQLRSLRQRSCKNPCLFPSRQFVPGGHQVMNAKNCMGEQSWVRAMRKALLDAVPLMTPAWSKLYSGHAMRVGGSNHMRKIGIADDIHKRLGGWMTLTAAQGYMALSPAEQFAYTVRLAEMPTRKSAMTRMAARAAFASLPRMY